ncbi:effector-associated constant component EACC1 [Pseudofrankia sp. BMG5.37]|uniref:effector-associated constant component EACC1 n=1 Tax=Pseudofrankia sp. BMG5.37 TaxID=3050035 RepID=UPI002893A525|nr:hypothetical protein [Pseudofrankia sp. BMG5.37]MDT3445596.1 hypothetical protein [Pseudofrankia sp. BMG5.37]
MSSVIRVRADSEEAVHSFARWLRDDPDVRRHAVISLEAAEARGGEMGGALDIVSLVIDTNFQILNFGLAYLAWRATRSKPSPVRIERPDGVTVTLNDADPEVIARLLRRLEE